MALCLAAPDIAYGETYRGITVASESRCAPYNKKADYPYSQSVELRIIERMGGLLYGPYTGRCFADRSQTQIEHVVATSEAHDSGLCAASAETRRQFAIDPLNLTLASRQVNQRKHNKDVGEWLPQINECWFVARTLDVRRKYGLTIDRREAAAAERVLAQCSSTEMEMLPCRAAPTPAPSAMDSEAH